MGSSFSLANPPIEQGRPTLINQPGGILADDLVTDEQLRSRLQALENELSGQFVSQDGLTQLLDRLLRMESEIQSLRGEVEELNERLRRAEADSRDRYIDLDRRLTDVQASGAQSLAGQAPETSDIDDPEEAQRDYRRARDLISERRYEEATGALADFVQDYPDSGLVADAWFWLGEVHTLLREYDSAEAAYNRIIDDFPDSDKRLDALFKLGFVAERTGDVGLAQDYYQRVVEQAPDSNLGSLANQRLDTLQEFQ